MAIDIKVDTREANRKLDELDRKAKDAGKIKLDPSHRPSGGSTAAAAAKGAQLRRNMAAGGDTSNQATSGLDEMSQGGFYESLKDKAEVLKKARDKTANLLKKTRHAGRSIWRKLSGKGKQPGVAAGGADAASEGQSNVHQLVVETGQIRNAVIQSVNIRGMRGRGTLQAPGISNSGGGGSGPAPVSSKSQIASALGTSLGILGGAVAAVGGALLKVVNDVGQRYVQSMLSQSETLGATGRYVVGKGPRGLFADSQMAQAEVAYAQATGLDTFGQRNRLDSNTMRFASRMGKSPVEIAQTLGVLNVGQKEQIGIQYLRDFAEQSGFGGLGQASVLTKLADVARSVSDRGYGRLDIKQFAPMAAGLSASDGIISPRGLTIAQNLDSKIRGGDTGGLIGQLALAARMQDGKDYFAATAELEKEGLTGSNLQSVRGLLGEDSQLFGYLMRKEGLSSFNEGVAAYGAEALDLKAKQDRLQVFENPGIAFQNRTMAAFGTGPGARAGRAAIKIAETGQKELIKLLNDKAGSVESIANGMHTVQVQMLDKLSAGVDTIQEIAADPGKFFSGMMEDAKSFVKSLVPSIF